MGTVTLSTQEPMAGTAITATLVDADGMISRQMWQWEKSTNTNSWMDIATGSGAMTRTYTPVAADEGYYLRATVTYTDAIGSDKTAYSDATTASPVTVTSGPTRAAGQSTTATATAKSTDRDVMFSGHQTRYFFG